MQKITTIPYSHARVILLAVMFVALAGFFALSFPSNEQALTGKFTFNGMQTSERQTHISPQYMDDPYYSEITSDACYQRVLELKEQLDLALQENERLREVFLGATDDPCKVIINEQACYNTPGCWFYTAEDGDDYKKVCGEALGHGCCGKAPHIQ